MRPKIEPRRSAPRFRLISSAAARRCLVALAFAAALVAIGIGAALTAWNCPMLPIFETCCVVPLGVVVNLELRPAVIELWSAAANARRAIRCFRRQLEALPETRHPLEA